MANGTSLQHVDVVIVGAGLSGIGIACHLTRECLTKTYAIVEARDDLDLAHVVQRMNSYAERLADARECALRFEVQEGIAAQHLGMTQRKNLYLILKEALNNAVKY